MAKPHAKSTLKEMKDYIRANKLNKPDIRLGMKKAEMVAALKKMGHWDPKHDGASAKKSAPKPAPKKQAPKKKAGEDPARDKKLYEKYVKELKKKTITKANLDNLKNIPDTYRNDILKKAMRDVYNQQQKKTVKPAPKKKPPPKKAGADTVAGQLLDLPGDISQLIGNQVLIKKATSDFDTFISVMGQDEEFTEERYDREDNILDGYSWGSDFQRIKRLAGIRNKRADYYDELTESQKETFQMTAFEQKREDHDEYLEELWKKNIKGKNFSSLKVMMNKFMNVYQSA